MSTRIPSTVKVGPHAYAVVLRPRAQMPKEDGEHMDGCCDFDGLTIFLRVGLRVSKKREYLLHEVLHAATYPTLNGKTCDDETFVEATAPPLLAILRENPKLVEYLCQTTP